MISCGHCGGAHATVPEVRQCSTGDGATPAALDPEFFPPDEDAPLAIPQPGATPQPRTGQQRAARPRANPSGASPRSSASARKTPASANGPTPGGILTPLDCNAQDLAGPNALGRCLLVDSDDDLPAAWSECLRMRVDPASTDQDMFSELRRIFNERERRVFVLTGPLANNPEHTIDGHAWELDPHFQLGNELLVWLLTANTVDGRNPLAIHFRPVQLAVQAGLKLDASSNTAGDVVMGTTPAWCDGGPLDTVETGDDTALIPAANLEAGAPTPLQNNPITAELAPDQLAAVGHPGDGARIIAPAGSGKTRVLTERVRHLINNRGINPAGICLVAFNVRAKQEMEERTTDLPGLEVRTLNSLGMAILNGNGNFVLPHKRRRRDVLNEAQVRDLLRPMIKIPRAAMTDPMAAWLDALSACRLGLAQPRQVEEDFSGDVTDFAKVVVEFREELERRGVMDFDEQIIGAIEVLLTDPNARRVARRNCQILLVDEFQDLTPAHMLLLRLLAGPRAGIFGVGDDDQTIYGFSGATPEWLIQFQDFVPGSGAHPLTVNYRCPPSVVEAADTLLTHNRRRVEKKIHAAPKRETVEGELQVATTDDPTTVTVNRVKELLDGGADPTSIAILTRVNTSLLAPMLALDQQGLPTTHPIGPRLLQRTGVAAALAWVRMATSGGRLQPQDVEQSARRPPRALSRTLIGWMTEQGNVSDLRRLAARLNKDRDTQKVMAYADDVEQLRKRSAGATTEDLLISIRDDLSLGDALDGLDSSKRSVDRSTHGDDMAALIAASKLEPDPTEFEAWLHNRLDQPGQTNGVRLSTVHRVKGLEWPHVIVHEATMGLMPHRLSADRAEERRIFHVAITRAQESLTVVAGTPASPYVQQMDRAWDPEKNVAEAPAPPRGAKAGQAKPKVKGRGKDTIRGGDRMTAPAELDLASRKVANRLREWRLTKCKEDKVPAYVIFKDATLEEIAIQKPGSLADLGRVNGIGPTKLERYGDEILAIIED